MDRKDVNAEYKVVDGVIVSPGKFESEPVYVPDYYEALLDGCGEDGEDGTVFFVLEEPDYEKWPELSGYDRLYLWTDDLGFIHHRLVKEEE